MFPGPFCPGNYQKNDNIYIFWYIFFSSAMSINLPQLIINLYSGNHIQTLWTKNDLNKKWLSNLKTVKKTLIIMLKCLKHKKVKLNESLNLNWDKLIPLQLWLYSNLYDLSHKILCYSREWYRLCQAIYPLGSVSKMSSLTGHWKVLWPRIAMNFRRVAHFSKKIPIKVKKKTFF